MKTSIPILKALATIIATFLATLDSGRAQQIADFDHSHATFTAVLKSHVTEERVDYAALKEAPSALDAYLSTLATVPEKTFNGWAKPERLAFLINLYNAATIKLVVDHYPVKSIKDIGSFIKGPWDQPVVDVFGKKLTLNHIEHEIIRKHYNEPRSHFGLVCASIGCPPLRGEAFAADRINTQLDEQGRAFFATASKNRVDLKAGVVYLSPIFKWFAEDFTSGGGTLHGFVSRYFTDESERRAVAEGSLAVRYTDYDWSLNRR